MISVWLHEVSSKHRVEDVGNHKRSKQCDNQRDGKVHHEFTNNSWPECQRNKWSQHNHGTRKYRKENLTGRDLSRFANRNFAIVKYTMGIFNHHDGIIYYNPEGK